MKKIMMAVLFAAFGATAAMAQSAAGEVYLKPMAGGTLTTLTKADNSKMKLGFVGGGELGYQITEQFAVTAGALFTMQGTGLKDADNVKDAKLDLTYMNVPVMFNYYVAPGLAIKAGVQPGFLLTAKYKATTFEGEESREVKADYDLKDAMKKFDFSIPVGISYEFDDFVIDARYIFGLSKVAKEAGTTVSFSETGHTELDNSSSRNSVIMLTFGYKIPL